jgi:hypothetical protein
MSPDRKRVSFPGLSITGEVMIGTRKGSDYVPAGSVGLNYGRNKRAAA